MLKRLLALVVAIVVLITVILFSRVRSPEPHISGRIEAEAHDLGSLTGGRVARVLVHQGEQVVAGGTLVELETGGLDSLQRIATRWKQSCKYDLYRAEHFRLDTGWRPSPLLEAEAYYEQTQQRVHRLTAGNLSEELAAATRLLDAARGNVDLATKAEARLRELLTSGEATEGDAARAREDLAAAEALVKVRQHDLDQLHEGTDADRLAEAQRQLTKAREQLDWAERQYRNQTIEQAKRSLEIAEEFEKFVDQQMAELVIRSPVAGTVQTVAVLPGDIVRPRSTVVTLLDRTRLSVQAFLPQSQLHLKPGQKVRITVDAYPNESFPGEVEFIADQAEYTPANVQTQSEQAKQVFRVNIRVLEGADRLRPGLYADIVVNDSEGRDRHARD